MLFFRVLAVAFFFVAGCKNPVFTRTKSQTAGPVDSPGGIDATAVPYDFYDYVMRWSKKSECVLTKPQPSPELDTFRCARDGNWQKFCDDFNVAGGGSDGVIAMCKGAEGYFGKADGKTCEYGHCGEASAIFGCQAALRGYPLTQIQICSPDYADHIFAMIQQKSGTFCILDRWTVPFSKEAPKGVGSVICDVKIVNRKVTVGDIASENPWYSDLSCKPIVGHYKDRCYTGNVLPDDPVGNGSEGEENYNP